MKNKKTSPAHTPTPWRADWLGDERGWILDDESNYLAEIVTADECGFVVPPKQQRANAVFIVRACNAHDDLVAALDDLLEQTVDRDLAEGIELTAGAKKARMKALAALKKANAEAA